jgi:menaquinone-9 beta-reductase
MIRIQQSFDCDVLIIGAGPAGATAAYYLARAGVNVWLLDKEVFPRDKVCGDFVGPVGLLELSYMGVTRDADFLKSNKINFASLFLNAQEIVAAPIPAITDLPPYGRVIPRKQLDQWIVNAACAAGARLMEACTLKQVELRQHAVVATVEQSKKSAQFRARLLIAADGSNSMVARSLRGYAPPDHDRIVAVRAYYENVDGPSDRADLYFSAASFPGYCWLFPTGEGMANVGVGVAAQTIPDGKFALKSLLQRLIDSDQALAQRLRHSRMIGKISGWPLTTYDHRLPIVWDRVMLTGDAAGLINPLNGEGIQYALLSGRWAAYYAYWGLRQDTLAKHNLMAYAHTVEQELRYDMAVSNMIVQLIRNRTLNPIWLRALQIIGNAASEQPGYAAIAGGVLAGLIPASNLLGYQIIGGSIKQAALTLGGEALYKSITDPLGYLRNTISLGGTGLKIAAAALQQPRANANWLGGVAASASELARQVYQGMTSHVPNR